MAFQPCHKTGFQPYFDRCISIMIGGGVKEQVLKSEIVCRGDNTHFQTVTVFIGHVARKYDNDTNLKFSHSLFIP